MDAMSQGAMDGDVTHTSLDAQFLHMSEKTLFSIIESSTHPNFTSLYDALGIRESKINSMRKAIAALKKQQPDFIVAEFFYGYGNNYAGVNISNLDVLLYSLQKYSAHSKVIILVDKSEFQYVGKLNEIITLHDVFTFPVNKKQLRDSLNR
jgi:hypothetical protein